VFLKATEKLLFGEIIKYTLYTYIYTHILYTLYIYIRRKYWEKFSETSSIGSHWLWL